MGESLFRAHPYNLERAERIFTSNKIPKLEWRRFEQHVCYLLLCFRFLRPLASGFLFSIMIVWQARKCFQVKWSLRDWILLNRKSNYNSSGLRAAGNWAISLRSKDTAWKESKPELSQWTCYQWRYTFKHNWSGLSSRPSQRYQYDRGRFSLWGCHLNRTTHINESKIFFTITLNILQPYI